MSNDFVVVWNGTTPLLPPRASKPRGQEWWPDKGGWAASERDRNRWKSRYQLARERDRNRLRRLRAKPKSGDGV